MDSLAGKIESKGVDDDRLEVEAYAGAITIQLRDGNDSTKKIRITTDAARKLSRWLDVMAEDLEAD